MINHPVFLARNVKDYLRREQVLVQADDSPIATVQGAALPTKWGQTPSTAADKLQVAIA